MELGVKKKQRPTISISSASREKDTSLGIEKKTERVKKLNFAATF